MKNDKFKSPNNSKTEIELICSISYLMSIIYLFTKLIDRVYYI